MRIRWIMWSCAMVVAIGCAAHRETIKAGPIGGESQPPMVASPDRPVPQPQASLAVLQQILLKLQRVHFGLDSVELHPEVRASLVEVAEQLIKYPQVILFIEGHADDRGTTEYNLSLSERRAKVVAEFLAHAGVPAERLQLRAKGEEVPLDNGSGELSWAINRRVDYTVQQGEVTLELTDGVLLDDSGNPIAPLVGGTLHRAGPTQNPRVTAEFLVAGFCMRRAYEIQLGAGALR